MLADPGLRATGWSAAFRGTLAERRRRRRRLAVAAIIAIGAAPPLLTLACKPPLLLVWNSSASAPVGLYRVHPGEVSGHGDVVIARTPVAIRHLAAERRYVPANVPLVKRVAAEDGDRVCASRRTIWINRQVAALRRRTDAAGRTMPWWRGCRTLAKSEIFLLGDGPDSFDGRYFGITRRSELIGRAVLLWAKRARGSGAGPSAHSLSTAGIRISRKRRPASAFRPSGSGG
jgi:conjugative transfer signal peptidase TraF